MRRQRTEAELVAPGHSRQRSPRRDVCDCTSAEPAALGAQREQGGFAGLGAAENGAAERPSKALEDVRRLRRAVAENPLHGALEVVTVAGGQRAHNSALAGTGVELHERVRRVVREEEERQAEGSGAAREDGVVAYDALLSRLDLGRPAGVSRAALAPSGSTQDVRREHQLTVRLGFVARGAVVTGAPRIPRVAAARGRPLLDAPTLKVHEVRRWHRRGDTRARCTGPTRRTSPLARRHRRIQR